MIELPKYAQYLGCWTFFNSNVSASHNPKSRKILWKCENPIFVVLSSYIYTTAHFSCVLSKWQSSDKNYKYSICRYIQYRQLFYKLYIHFGHVRYSTCLVDGSLSYYSVNKDTVFQYYIESIKQCRYRKSHAFLI